MFFTFLNFFKRELIEGDKIKLKCCTNADANPQVQFKWFKQSYNKTLAAEVEIINNNNVKLFSIDISHDLVCSTIEVNVNRYDNNYEYKCNVQNEALNSGLNETIRLAVECKFLFLFF